MSYMIYLASDGHQYPDDTQEGDVKLIQNSMVLAHYSTITLAAIVRLLEHGPLKPISPQLYSRLDIGPWECMSCTRGNHSSSQLFPVVGYLGWCSCR